MTALVLRLAVTLAAVSVPERLYRPDTAGYLDPARDLAERGEYSTTRRPPGFPAVAALIYRAGGGDRSVAVVLAICGAAAAAVVAYTGIMAFNKASGITAGMLYAFNITALGNAPLLLSDTLFGLFIAAAFLFFMKFRNSHRRRDLLICAAISALAVLIRPINSLFIAPLLFLLFITGGISWKQKTVCAVAALGIFAMLTVPWMIRNSRRGAGFCIDTNTGAMYHQNGAVLLGTVKGNGFEAEKRRILAEQDKLFADTSSFPDERSREEWRIARYKEAISAHFWLWLRQQIDCRVLLPDAPSFLEAFGVTSSDRGTMAVLKEQGFFAAIRHYFGEKWFWILLMISPLLAVYALTAVAFASAVVCKLRFWRTEYFDLFVLLAFVEYYLLLPGSITAPRYQLPALPCICVFGAAAMVNFVARFRKKDVTQSDKSTDSTEKIAAI